MRKGNNRTPAPITYQTEEVKAPVTEEVNITEPEEKLVDGIVDGVQRALNIRKKPKVEANNQIAILSKGTKLIIVDPDKPVKADDNFWYKVKVGEERGYAMKKYIRIL